jgi:TonB family protein
MLVEFLVRSTLLALCAAVGLFVLRIRVARVRHGVWAGVMAAMLILPVWSEWGPKAVLPLLTPAPGMAVTRLALDMNGQVVSIVPVRPAFWTVERVLIAVWLIGVSVLLSRLLTGTIRTDRLRRLGGEGLVTPITVGWLRPSIILPAGWREWPAEQLRAVMTHEQEHARRRDPLVQWLALFNRAVFWFHPLAWWLEKRLAGLSEEACDDAVLMNGHDPLEYSEFLLGLARGVREAGARVEIVGMAMPGTFLPERIRRIAGGVKVQRISGARITGLAAICGAAAMVCAAGSIGYRAAPVTVVKVEPAAIQPKADAPILMAQVQTPGQSVRGSVFDPARLPVPGVPVTLTNEDTGATHTATTNDQGDYRISGFPAGTYSVSVQVPGFRALKQTGVRVGLGESRNTGKMSLEVGRISESLNVSGSRNTPVPFVGTLGPMTTIQNTSPPAPAPPPVASPLPSTGGKVGPANLINEVRPSYPVELQRAGVAGTVRLEGIISKDGMLTGTRMISSPDAALTQAAMDAVSQWRYRPSSLDGQPIEVMTTIDVNYSLRD